MEHEIYLALVKADDERRFLYDAIKELKEINNLKSTLIIEKEQEDKEDGSKKGNEENHSQEKSKQGKA